MRSQSSPGTPQAARQLELARRSLAHWRGRRKRGMRIPEAVWEAAVKAAKECGLGKAASVLGLDYYELKRRVGAASGGGIRLREQASPAFVELPQAMPAEFPECTIEFEGKHGGKMRVHLKGSGTLDVASLGRDFWNAES